MTTHRSQHRASYGTHAVIITTLCATLTSCALEAPGEDDVPNIDVMSAEPPADILIEDGHTHDKHATAGWWGAVYWDECGGVNLWNNGFRNIPDNANATSFLVPSQPNDKNIDGVWHVGWANVYKVPTPAHAHWNCRTGKISCYVTLEQQARGRVCQWVNGRSYWPKLPW